MKAAAPDIDISGWHAYTNSLLTVSMHMFLELLQCKVEGQHFLHMPPAEQLPLHCAQSLGQCQDVHHETGCLRAAGHKCWNGTGCRATEEF